MKNLTPILLIIISVAVFFVFIDPQFREVKKALAEKEENATMLELADELSRKRTELHDRYNNITPQDREDLLKLLPDTVDNVRLILDINNIAESFGVTITNINVTGGENLGVGESAPSPLDSVGTITLSFSVVAPYDLFIELMRALEESLRIVDIRTLNISAGGERDTATGAAEQIFYNYSVTLDTYWLR